jgi:sialate O-acetylesterase
MQMRLLLAAFLLFLACFHAGAQTATTWNGKGAAVVLTYDDAVNIDIDHVAPALDSFGLKGTFYVIGSSPVVDKRMAAWRAIAANGHELGNHSSFHPCDGQKPGRSFVTPETDLSRYTIKRMKADVLLTNTLLQSIDGKTERTFAYPCGDLTINDTAYYDYIKGDFIAARGVGGKMSTINEVNLSNISCYAINGQDGAYMIDLVKKAQASHTLLVFLFHGVGGGHSLNVSGEAHTRLLQYLKSQENNIWIAPMVEVARFVKQHR